MGTAKYAGETRLRIIDTLVEGLSRGETMVELCRADGMPTPRLVYQWMEADPELASQIARAREVGYETIAEQCLAIAEDGTNDYMEQRDKDGAIIGWRVNGEYVARSKLRIETRLKLLSKWAPKKYGDVQKLEHSGPDGAPIELANTTGLATAAAKELRQLRMAKGALPAPDAPEGGEDLL